MLAASQTANPRDSEMPSGNNATVPSTLGMHTTRKAFLPMQ
jgi:hypothetical protein